MPNIQKSNQLKEQLENQIKNEMVKDVFDTLKQLAELEDADANYILGKCYEEPLIGKEGQREVVSVLINEKLNKNLDTSSIIEIVGIKPDRVKTIEYFNRAKELGHEKAAQALQVEEQRFVVDIDTKFAELSLKAVKQIFVTQSQGNNIPDFDTKLKTFGSVFNYSQTRLSEWSNKQDQSGHSFEGQIAEAERKLQSDFSESGLNTWLTRDTSTQDNKAENSVENNSNQFIKGLLTNMTNMQLNLARGIDAEAVWGRYEEESESDEEENESDSENDVTESNIKNRFI